MNKEVVEIVSKFTGIKEDALVDQSFIDQRVVKNSILLHRMYAALAEKGFILDNYHEIKTFGDLRDQLFPTEKFTAVPVVLPVAQDVSPVAIGIDLEDVENFPKTNDFRKHTFYTDNFDPSEISHCIMQPDPYISFCGLFAAKESIVKADNQFQNFKFKDIVIKHNVSGKPEFLDFGISISHTNNIATAVAVKQNNILTQNSPENSPSKKSFPLLSIIAIILAIIAICLCVFN